jgi:MFS family permease
MLALRYPRGLDAVMSNRLLRFLASHASGLPATFWWLWSGALLSALATFVFPFLALFLTARGLSPSETGFVASLFAGGMIFAGPVGGALADRIGRKPTLLVCLVVAAACAAVLALVASPVAIAALVFLFGVSSQGTNPAIMAMLADVVPEESRARAYGLVYWANNVGLGVSLVGGGLLAQKGWALPFCLDAATTLLFAGVLLLKIPETRPVAEAAKPASGFAAFIGLSGVLRDRVFVAFLLLVVAFALAFWQFQVALPITMTLAGLEPKAFGAVLAVNTVVIATVQPWSSKPLSRLSQAQSLSLAAALVGIGNGAYAFCRTPVQFGLATAVWSLGEIAFLPVAAAVTSELAPPEMRGRYSGALGLAFGVSGFAATALGPALLQRAGPPALWFSCLALGAAVAVGQLLFGRMLRSRILAGSTGPAAGTCP